MCSGIDQTLIVGIYAPHVWHMDTSERTLWLIAALTTVEEEAAAKGLQGIWISGDLHIRGLFPGEGRKATVGSSHATLSRTLRDLLRKQGLQPITTQATHSRGGALDGRTTNKAGRYTATVEQIEEVQSDHCLTHVDTTMPMPNPLRTYNAEKQRDVTVYNL